MNFEESNSIMLIRNVNTLVVQDEIADVIDPNLVVILVCLSILSVCLTLPLSPLFPFNSTQNPLTDSCVAVISFNRLEQIINSIIQVLLWHTRLQ